MPSWLPNALSALRIVSIPVFIALADAERRGGALAVLVAIGLSDVVDGLIARRFGLTSQLGATLDAVADKLTQICLLLYFTFWPSAAFEPFPVWFTAVILGRDLVLAAGSLTIRLGRGSVTVVHEPHGKAASVLIFALLLWVTAGLPSRPLLPLMLALVVIVALSTFGYVRFGWRQWRGESV